MARGIFFRFFPVPSFVLMPGAGVSITDEAIRFVQFSSSNGRLELKAYGEILLPEGAIVAGHIVQPETVTGALSIMVRDHDIKFVHATVPDERVYIFKTALPPIDKEDIRGALEFKLEEHVPMTVAESVFDYVAESHKTEDGNIEAVVGVIAESEAALYSGAIRKAGLVPLSLEIESQAVANSVVPLEEKGLVLIANMDANKTGIYLVDKNVVHFTTTLANEDALAGGQAVLPRDAMEKRLPLIKGEIEKLSNYWRAHGGTDSKIDKLILCGNGANDSELIDHFAHTAGREVSIADAWANAEFAGGRVPELHKEESLKYAAAIGAALPQDKQ